MTMLGSCRVWFPGPSAAAHVPDRLGGPGCGLSRGPHHLDVAESVDSASAYWGGQRSACGD